MSYGHGSDDGKEKSFEGGVYDQLHVQCSVDALGWIIFVTTLQQKKGAQVPSKAYTGLTYAKIGTMIKAEEISARQQAVWSYNSKWKGGVTMSQKRHPYGPTTQSPCTATPDRGLSQPPNKGQGSGLSPIKKIRGKIPA
jgi:hypothetical protein